MYVTLGAVVPDPAGEALTGAIDGVAGSIVGAETHLCTAFPIPTAGAHCDAIKEEVELQTRRSFQARVRRERFISAWMSRKGLQTAEDTERPQSFRGEDVPRYPGAHTQVPSSGEQEPPFSQEQVLYAGWLPSFLFVPLRGTPATQLKRADGTGLPRIQSMRAL
ncbi:hypothetical protein JZ751_019660, partial [Albula glossodonta]